jgi:hypothetical protein
MSQSLYLEEGEVEGFKRERKGRAYMVLLRLPHRLLWHHRSDLSQHTSLSFHPSCDLASQSDSHRSSDVEEAPAARDELLHLPLIVGPYELLLLMMIGFKAEWIRCRVVELVEGVVWVRVLAAQERQERGEGRIW